MDKEKYDSWMIAPEVWKEAAAVSNFMRDEIKKGLRDANGDPLPGTINEFFLDLLFQRVKPRKGGKFIPSVKDCIREQYRQLLLFEEMTGTSEKLRGDYSTSERLKNSLAERFHTTSATIDQIVAPRKSRKRLPRKS